MQNGLNALQLASRLGKLKAVEIILDSIRNRPDFHEILNRRNMPV
jgi:hypothetical protein